MTAPDDYCDLCDLPRSQCVHGRPPPEPTKRVTSPPKPRKRPAARRRPAAGPDKPPTRRWSPPEMFKPFILTLLEDAGGELEADELFLELEILVEDRLLPGDSERTPEGELRWQLAARRARMALIAEGLMARTRPGAWQLARPRQDSGRTSPSD